MELNNKYVIKNDRDGTYMTLSNDGEWGFTKTEYDKIHVWDTEEHAANDLAYFELAASKNPDKHGLQNVAKTFSRDIHLLHVTAVPYENPTVTKDEKLGQYFHHPCFGAIELNRMQVTPPMPLFGSEIRHGTMIALRISTAEMHRNLSNDRHFARKNLIEVYISQSQLMEMFSSMNMGSGIPCTIQRFNGTKVTQWRGEDITEKFYHDADEGIEELIQVLEQTKSLANEEAEGKTTKTGRRAVRDGINTCIRRLTDSIPFIKDQFTRTMKGVVTKAKQEVDFHIENRAKNLGADRQIEIPANPKRISEERNGD